MSHYAYGYTCPDCPVCKGRGRVTAPELSMMQAECRDCGWFYTVPRACEVCGDGPAVTQPADPLKGVRTCEPCLREMEATS